MQSLSHSTQSSMQQQSTQEAAQAAQPERALTKQDCQHLPSLNLLLLLLFAFAHRPTLHSTTLHCHHHATSHQPPPAWSPVLLQHRRARRAQLPLQLLPLRAYCLGASLLLLLPGWRLLGPAPFQPLCLLMQSRWSWTWSAPQQPSQSGPCGHKQRHNRGRTGQQTLQGCACLAVLKEP